MRACWCVGDSTDAKVCTGPASASTHHHDRHCVTAEEQTTVSTNQVQQLAAQWCWVTCTQADHKPTTQPVRGRGGGYTYTYKTHLEACNVTLGTIRHKHLVGIHEAGVEGLGNSLAQWALALLGTVAAGNSGSSRAQG